MESNMSQQRRGPCRPSLAARACRQSSSSPCHRSNPQNQMKEKLIMKTRIALLLAVASLLAGSAAAQPAPKPLDPDQAPIAAVDRFSDKAAHLQLRTPDNHIPGPNQPVDFDTGPFITQGLSPTTGKPVRYYNFDVQTTTPAPVYVLYREGDGKPVAGQLDIIDTLPGEKGYNDFRQFWRGWVPTDYVPNTITDAGALSQAGYKTENTNTLRNMPVPDKSTARERSKGESAELHRAWYRGQVAKFFSFEKAPLSGNSVSLSPIYVSFNINPGQPNGDLGKAE